MANYPWDGTLDRQTHYAASPDDATFRYLARVYSKAHSNMASSREFEGGITNGAAWYPLWGGMQVRGSCPTECGGSCCDKAKLCPPCAQHCAWQACVQVSAMLEVLASEREDWRY